MPCWLVAQGCKFHPQSGHLQGPTNKCINKWDNKSMSLSLSLSNQQIRNIKKYNTIQINKYLLSTCYVLVTILGKEYIVNDQTLKFSFLVVKKKRVPRHYQ